MRNFLSRLIDFIITLGGIIPRRDPRADVKAVSEETRLALEALRREKARLDEEAKKAKTPGGGS